MLSSFLPETFKCLPLSLVLNQSYLHRYKAWIPGLCLTVVWCQLHHSFTRPWPHCPKPLLLWGFYTWSLFPEISFPRSLQDSVLFLQVSACLLSPLERLLITVLKRACLLDMHYHPNHTMPLLMSNSKIKHDPKSGSSVRQDTYILCLLMSF